MFDLWRRRGRLGRRMVGSQSSPAAHLYRLRRGLVGPRSSNPYAASDAEATESGVGAAMTMPAPRQQQACPETDAICRVLRRAMEQSGISEADLADRLGVTPQAVSQVLRYRYSANPGVVTLARYAAALGLRLRLVLEPSR